MMKRLLLLLLLASCQKTPEPVETIRPVRVEVVTSPEEARKRIFSGTAKASEESVLSFKVSGTIVSLPINVGDEFTKGQVLASLDPKDYELEVEKAEANLARSGARLRNATAQYDRVRKLYETRTASRTDLDNARAEYEGAAAQVASDRKALSLAERQFGYATLIAPVDGWIARKIAEVNENVQPNQPVAEMVSGTDPELDIQFPEVLIGKLERGATATAKFPALGDKILDATVIYIGVATTGTSTTYPVTLRIDDPHHQVRSGMTAEVTFSLPYEEGEEVVTIPSVAVGQDLEGAFVFIVADYDGRQGVIERVPVTVGEILGNDIEIHSGLKGGERVVVAGLENLSSGQRVTIYKGKPYGDQVGN